MTAESLPFEAKVALALEVLPPFLRLELLADPAFSENLPITLDGTIRIGNASFRRTSFFDAVRSAYDSPTVPVTLTSLEGSDWALEVDEAQGTWPLKLEHADDRMRLKGLYAIHPDAGARLGGLRTSAKNLGLDTEHFATWSDLLRKRPLTSEEVRLFDENLAATPVAAADAIKDSLEVQEVSIEVIVPTTRRYYERLIGSLPADTLADYVNQVAPQKVESLLAWQPDEGARFALLLGSHPRILSGTELTELPAKSLTKLGAWLRDHGDLFSKVAFVELSLPRLAKSPTVRKIAKALITEIRDLDPEDPGGRLHLTSALFVLTYGEIARTKALAGWPPFRKRLAALAHAALIERQLIGKIDHYHFAKWCFETRSQVYHLQGLIDLREEPRWQPEYASPEQFKNEFLGRLVGAADLAKDAPDIADLLMGDNPDSLRSRANFPQAFWPGPLEGTDIDMLITVPSTFKDMLDSHLDANPFKTTDLFALINLRSMFAFDPPMLNKAIERVKQALPHLANDVAEAKLGAVFEGLAYFAAVQRCPELSDEIRVLVRKRRFDYAEPSSANYVEELQLALVAAAAHTDINSWAEFIGTWALELATKVPDLEQARQLHDWLDTLCTIEPALRITCGRALAALKLFIQK